MGIIALPTTYVRRGNAFETLILSYYSDVNGLEVEEWSSYLYGNSGKLYQCDGILSDRSKRYLLEAKFFENRSVNLRDLKIKRREAAAADLNCDAILCISLNGFDDSVRKWQKKSKFEILLAEWQDLRPHILSKISDYASVLMDFFTIDSNVAISETGSEFHFNSPPVGNSIDRFPEFVSFSDEFEKWLRRLPKFNLARAQMASGDFFYDASTTELELRPDRKSELSLWEAWQLEDQLYGYAARVYPALKVTAEAVQETPDKPLSEIQKWLRSRNWDTGEKGIRKALDDLIILGFILKKSVGRRVHYSLTPIGVSYVLSGNYADEIFLGALKKWLPYKKLSQAITAKKVDPKRESIINYFKKQYNPYQPYARSPFNENSTDGLLSLYRHFADGTS